MPSSSRARSAGAASGARAGSGSTTTIATSAIASARAPSAAKPIEPGHIDDGELVAEILEIVEIEFGRAAALAASGLELPMLEPLAVDPNRSVAPAANSIASARLVFPAPAGPTSAITRVPLDGCPAMRTLPSSGYGRASRSRERRSGACLETSTVRLFLTLGKRDRYGVSGSSRNVRRALDRGFCDAWSIRKGHQAGAPTEMPAPAWQDIAKRTYKRTWDDNVGLVAAGSRSMASSRCFRCSA